MKQSGNELNEIRFREVIQEMIIYGENVQNSIKLMAKFNRLGNLLDDVTVNLNNIDNILNED